MKDVALNHSTFWNLQWWRLAQVEVVDLRYMASPIRVISGQLWCCCGFSGIVILNAELQQQRKIPCGDMESVIDVAQARDDDVIIAARRGVYTMRPDGT